MQDVRHITVGADADGQRLDRWLKKQLPKMPYALLQKMMRTGQVRIDGKRAKAETRLSAGQDVRLPPAEEKDYTLTFIPKPGDDKLIRNMVIYDDGDLLAINKPYGLAVQGGPATKRHIDGLLPHLTNEKGERPKLVHRIDRDTSGVLLCARSLEMTRNIGKMFAGRGMRKLYWALIVPAPERNEGVLDAPMMKGFGADKEIMVIDHENGKTAKTWFQVIDRAAGKAATVAFWPKTGRTHQIRLHSAALLGCPIMGDERYNGVVEAFDAIGVNPRLHLHAARLEFIHPDTRVLVKLAAPLPAELLQSCKALGLSDKIPADVFADFSDSD